MKQLSVGQKVASASTNEGLIPHTTYVVMVINPLGKDGKTVVTLRPYHSWLYGDTSHNDRCVTDLESLVTA